MPPDCIGEPVVYDLTQVSIDIATACQLNRLDVQHGVAQYTRHYMLRVVYYTVRIQ